MTEADDLELTRRMAQDYARVGHPDPEAQARLIARIRREPSRRGSGSGRRIWPWSPELGLLSLGQVATAVLVLALGVGLGWTARDRWAGAPERAGGPDLANLGSTGEVRLVQFVIAAPRASRVAVVGDFNDWDPGATPMRRRDGGSWTAAIPLSPGRHVYAFVVDGDRWLADPAAPLAPEDGYGIRNSVIVVGGMEST